MSASGHVGRPVTPQFRLRCATKIELCVATLMLALWCWSIACDGASGMVARQAYIGPGAGIAVLGSFFVVLLALLSAITTMLTWPIRRIWRAIRSRKANLRARVKRVVIIGLDGLEPTLTERFMDQGLLPNLASLRDRGSYMKLGTTCPPLSPVAWSSFSTGVNPGKHNIFDFIDRNPRDYRPRISSVRIEPGRRSLRMGKFVLPLSKPSINSLRKSKPFWNVLGEAGVFSAVLRVPITFPPDNFRGVQLSAMCVPDLRGTQGMFSYFAETGVQGAIMDGDVGGERITVTRNGRGVEARLPGPINPFQAGQPEVCLPLRVVAGRDGGVVMHIDGQQVPLTVNRYTPWVSIRFPLAVGVKVRGLCRFFLKRFEPPFEMYCTPVQIDPNKPVMPISHPKVYSIYLARLLGSFATLGLAEDTWSLSEQLMSEDAFLTQAYDIHDERRRMLLDSLDRVKRGLVACVFDAPDRIQHMFWRFIDEGHPALADRPNTHADAIGDMYVKMDETVGEVLKKVDPDTAVFVMSDHGFKSFRRGVDLNAWLLANGYLKLTGDAASTDRQYLVDVDWSRTRAYAIGLAGIFINRKGRESQGIVEPGKATDQLVGELTQKLTGLRDPDHDEEAVHEAIPCAKAYKGPYVDAAPDLIVGYRPGYRVAWDAAVGKCGSAVFSDNTKAWSGDHCVHPRFVPGVLFSNLKLNAGDANIIDMAPTALELLGVEKPRYMEGKSLLCADVDLSN